MIIFCMVRKITLSPLYLCVLMLVLNTPML